MVSASLMAILRKSGNGQPFVKPYAAPGSAWDVACKKGQAVKRKHVDSAEEDNKAPNAKRNKNDAPKGVARPVVAKRKAVMPPPNNFSYDEDDKKDKKPTPKGVARPVVATRKAATPPPNDFSDDEDDEQDKRPAPKKVSKPVFNPALEQVIEWDGPVNPSPHRPAHGEAVFEKRVAEGLKDKATARIAIGRVAKSEGAGTFRMQAAKVVRACGGKGCKWFKAEAVENGEEMLDYYVKFRDPLVASFAIDDMKNQRVQGKLMQLTFM
ncbi:hypothetical protein B0A55_12135 [Friedmanniomyces simplex]|uniref:Uncharacterized protein n=1 Tax=Friedmanniomyces simplex TaxID=329884 RepID=A0A4U0WA99_9PEZI|nr:hypothetical protein B0A55_12135 [Friedmanniomyces simplex]